MKILLKIMACDYVIDGPSVEADHKATGTEGETMKSRFVTADAKAFHMITKHLSDENHIYIRSCTNALEAWNILKTIYEGKAETKLDTLNMQFHNLKVKEGKVAEYISKLNKITTTIHAIDK